MPAKGLIAVLLPLLSMNLAAEQTPPETAPNQATPTDHRRINT